MSRLAQEIKKIPKNYFSLNDIKKISFLKEASLKVALHRLVKKGELTKLGNKLYTLDLLEIDYEKLACEIYNPSYVSFASALAYHNILSQKPVHISLATSKRTKHITIENKDIYYHHIQPRLFWGYLKMGEIFLAEAEKAFLDMAYLSLNGQAVFDIKEMNLDLLDKNKLKKYLNKYSNKKLNSLIAK